MEEDGEGSVALGGDPGVVNHKVPSSLLLAPDGSFHSFGHSARDHFHDLEPGEAARWMYFECFKMDLYRAEVIVLSSTVGLSRESTLRAANGKPQLALKVLELVLRHFGSLAARELEVSASELSWVLTVPTLWRQPARQLMRAAARRAGLDRLTLVLEPEAAALHCLPRPEPGIIFEHLLVQYLYNGHLCDWVDPGWRYLVVDCGGGTVDLTAHQITDSGARRELHKACGGPLGASQVDKAFVGLLESIFGSGYVARYRDARPAGMVDLLVAWEARKRNSGPVRLSPLNVALPFSFIDLYRSWQGRSVEEAVRRYGDQQVEWSSQGMLRLHPAVVESLFRPTVEEIAHLVAETVSQVGGVDRILLVGGFAESGWLQRAVRQVAGDTEVVVPHDAGIAVLQGAVQAGLSPLVVERKATLTYGVGVLQPFVPETHPECLKLTSQNVAWCADILDCYVKAGEVITGPVQRRYIPSRPGQRLAVLPVFSSERDDVQYVSEKGVRRCATLRLDLPESSQAEILTSMDFGDTEITVTAVDEASGRSVEAEIDFLDLPPP
ncbi:HSPA12B [Cordylochernes scorpioides]|uniref:HSPA12B n=1 Tax=Cordylochernes scorpioides TaxID=51811 RepID=A0ABY6K2S8_9ARAC|nr:HSPA12B [Cordylochernes scorpioides]